MKITFQLVTAFVLFFYSSSLSQTGWFIIPGVTPESLYEIIIDAANNQWTVGNNGTILKTTDLGENWLNISSGITLDLKGLYSPSSSEFWAAGDSGIVIVSTDAGTTWNIRSPGTNVSFSSIFSRGSATAYVIGESGSCFYSEDAGMSWAPRPVPTIEDLNAGVGPTSGTTLHALVGGNNGVIFKTTDAGVNWTQSNSGTSNNINAFGFGSGKIFAVGNNGTILNSTDAGDTWSSNTSPTIENLFSISSSGLIASGSNGTIIKSTDNGDTWFLQSSPTSEDLFSASAFSNSIHFAVGNNGIVLKTTDGGGNPVSIEDVKDVPLQFEVYQNFPNPFNPTTTINYQIPELSFVTLKVYDVLGSEIATLVDEEKPIGNYEVEFDAQSATGGLSSGIYFYRLQVYPANGGAGSFIETKKMVLMK